MSKKHSEIHKNSLWDAHSLYGEAGGGDGAENNALLFLLQVVMNLKEEEEEIPAFKTSLVASLRHSSKL